LNSRYSFGDLRRRLQESDVTIYSIGIGIRHLPQKGTLGGGIPGAIPLDRLASVSGGKSFYPKNANEMAEVFESIALELRRRYSIGYLPSNFLADGKWHRVKVAVTVPQESSRLIVRTREGYYAVKNPDDHQKQERPRPASRSTQISYDGMKEDAMDTITEE
jgi:VWFA-related protein